MAWLLDTNVAIHYRDGDLKIIDRLAALPSDPLLSVVTRLELEAGVYRNSNDVASRRRRLDDILMVLAVLPFRDAEAAAYGQIVAASGYSRTRVLDRMIAAQALVRGATLITMNGADFRDIAGLSLEVWPAV